MPRPQTGNKASYLSANPISAWFVNRRERKAQEAEKAARMITDQTASNENLLQNLLEGINFIHSKLPKKTLEYRSSPSQKYGDLENTAKGLAQAIRKNPLVVDVDIRKIDEKLLVLAQRYRDAIEQGNEHAAYAAKGALTRGILDIRNKIPVHQPELIEQFVELNTQYLDEWITLVGFAQLADETQKNAEKLKEKYDQTKTEYDAEVKTLYDELQSDASLREALAFVRNQSSTASKSAWTEDQRKVYGMMLDQRFKRVNIDLDAYLFQSEQTSLQKYLNDVDILSAKLARVPIAVDPDQMNKYKEAIDNLFMDLAKKDAELEETLTVLDEIEGRLLQMETAPGNQMAKQVVSDEVDTALDKMKEMEKKKVGERLADRKQELSNFGLHTEEELRQMKNQIEEENQQIMEQLVAEAEQVDGESEQNYN